MTLSQLHVAALDSLGWIEYRAVGFDQRVFSRHKSKFRCMANVVRPCLPVDSHLIPAGGNTASLNQLNFSKKIQTNMDECFVVYISL